MFVVWLRSLIDLAHPQAQKFTCQGRGLTQRKKVVKSKGVALYPLRLERAKVPTVVHINEEMKAAKAAKAAINALLTATPKSAVLATLNKAKHDAILNLSSGGTLNEARANVGIAISNLLHGLPTPEKIDKAERTIEAWIVELEAAKL